MSNGLQPSASMEVSRLAGELEQKGEKVFVLSVGDTHFPPPLPLQKELSSLPAAYSHYTVGQGIFELRKEIADYEGCIYDASEVVVVPGLKQGLYYALSALEGKRLCVLEPAWLGYKSLAILAGKEYIAIDTTKSDWQDQLHNASYDIILICSPNNPTGRVLSAEEVTAITASADRNNAWIITDEIYDSYIYDENITINPVRRIHGQNRVIVGNGFSKSHAMTGYRLGYLMTKNKDVLVKMNNIHQNLATCAPAISQYTSLGFSNASTQQEVNSFSAYYRDNSNMIAELFPELLPYKPHGGFYYFINLADFGVTDGNSFCKELLVNKQVAVVPGSAYGTGFDSYIRLSFSVERETLKEGILRFKSALI